MPVHMLCNCAVVITTTTTTASTTTPTTTRTCVCENGFAATGEECPRDGDEKCKSCRGTFVLIDGACVLRKWAKISIKVVFPRPLWTRLIGIVIAVSLTSSESHPDEEPCKR